jgi:hypothetical protein
MPSPLDEITFKHNNSNFDIDRTLECVNLIHIKSRNANQKLKCPSKIVTHKPPLPKKKRSQKNIEQKRIKVIVKKPPLPRLVKNPNINPANLYSDMGIPVVNPEQYITQFGDSLVPSSAIPDFIKSIRPLDGQKLAADQTILTYRLVGDVEALKLLEPHSNSPPKISFPYHSNTIHNASHATSNATPSFTNKLKFANMNQDTTPINKLTHDAFFYYPNKACVYPHGLYNGFAK